MIDMGINKVVMNTNEGENVLIDLTKDTVTPESMDEGIVAHDAAGEKIVGTRNTNYTVTTTGTGAAYLAEVSGITELVPGVRFMMIPHVNSTTASPTLNVNGLGDKAIRRRMSNSTSSTVAGSTANWIVANKPVSMLFDGTFWIVDDLQKPNAADLYGTVPIANGGVPPFTEDDVNSCLFTDDDGGISWMKLGAAAFCEVVNNGNTTEPGFVTDARQTTKMQGQIDATNTIINKVLGNFVYEQVNSIASMADAVSKTRNLNAGFKDSLVEIAKNISNYKTGVQSHFCAKYSINYGLFLWKLSDAYFCGMLSTSHMYEGSYQPVFFSQASGRAGIFYAVPIGK